MSLGTISIVLEIGIAALLTLVLVAVCYAIARAARWLLGEP
jgi:hypothetical protein